MTPNFEDLSCEFAFGQDALSAEEDPLMQEVSKPSQAKPSHLEAEEATSDPGKNRGGGRGEMGMFGARHHMHESCPLRTALY